MVDPATIPALLEKHRSLRGIARATGASWRSVQGAYSNAVQQGLMPHIPMGRTPHSRLKPATVKQRRKALKTKRARHQRYILTCAQNNTHVHPEVWHSLTTLADHYGAKLLVSTFLYANRSHWQQNLDKAVAGKRAEKGERGKAELWFDPAVVPYINNDRVEIAKGLVWCGELNISPTAGRPLSGLEVYTGRASMIVPHVKIALDSIATVGGDGTKFNYTTGTVTQRNYIQRKEGFKAEFHHCYGGLIVEVDEEGDWFCRQLNADSDGTIYDLDVKVCGGKITTGNRVEGLNLGDTHVGDDQDPTIEKATFGKKGLVSVLNPKNIIAHDVLNFGRRSHHKLKDPYKMLKQFAQGRECVENEVKGVKDWLKSHSSPDCLIVVVDSNHDRHLDRWLADNDGRWDPVNARYWSRLNHWKVEYIAANGEEPAMLPFAIAMTEPDFEDKYNVLFLDSDSSFILCPTFAGGIECSLHGDRGANGARGSARGIARLGRRTNIGHSHSARIDEGCYQSGTNSLLKLDYNHGPSSWSHSDIVTYPNSKRAIITFRHGKWRA
jgi:hypothetical protein